ncbi:conserved hypothetical protein [Burkholderiales bacterium 8X]|nr:conserved hypothetical protein [Burkholderiales bacterium 8X]
MSANPTPSNRQSFTLYATEGRIYASNVRQKLVDLGRLEQVDGDFVYELDGDGHQAGGFESADEALKDMARGLSFLHLDGQFTALADLRGESGPDLSKAVRLDIELDELGASEPAVDPNA